MLIEALRRSSSHRRLLEQARVPAVSASLKVLLRVGNPWHPFNVVKPNPLLPGLPRDPRTTQIYLRLQRILEKQPQKDRP